MQDNATKDLGCSLPRYLEEGEQKESKDESKSSRSDPFKGVFFDAKAFRERLREKKRLMADAGEEELLAQIKIKAAKSF